MILDQNQCFSLFVKSQRFYYTKERYVFRKNTPNTCIVKANAKTTKTRQIWVNLLGQEEEIGDGNNGNEEHELNKFRVKEAQERGSEKRKWIVWWVIQENKEFCFDARTRGGNCSKFTEYEDGVTAALGQSEGATCPWNEKRFSCCDWRDVLTGQVEPEWI